MFFVWALPVACVGRGRNTWVHACYYSLQNSHTGYMYVYVYLSSLHTAMHTAVSNVGHIALTRTPYGCIMFVERGGALKETCLEQLSPCSVSHVSEVSPRRSSCWRSFGPYPRSANCTALGGKTRERISYFALVLYPRQSSAVHRDEWLCLVCVL